MNYIQRKASYMNSSFKTVKACLSTSFSIMKWQFVMMFMIRLFFAVFAVFGIFVYREIFTNIESQNSSTYLLFGLFAIYCVYMLISKLEVVLYERYILHYTSLSTFEYKIRKRIHQKANAINLLELEKEEYYTEIQRAQNASINIYRVTEIVISILVTTIGIVLISSYFARINALYLILILLAALPVIVEKSMQAMKASKVNENLEMLRRQEQEIVKLSHSANHFFEIKVFNVFSFLKQKWQFINSEKNQLQNELNTYSSILEFFLGLIGLIGEVGGIVLASLIFAQNKDFGLYTSSIIAFELIKNFMKNISSLFGYMSMFVVLVSPYYALMNKDEEKNGKMRFNIGNTIDVNINSFKYLNGGDILSDINLSIKSGETIAIVGRNGSGKTTLSKILLGLYSLDNGKIVTGGVDYKQFDMSNTYKYFTTVFQEYGRYPTTILDNVTFGSVLSKEKQQQYNILKNNLSIEVDDLEKLGKEFGDRDLSGGQWQKLAIIRGLVKDSEVIVLDEPTASIDPLAEASIFREFESYVKDKTAIIIAHRLSSIKFVDRIIVLENGKIIEQGSHNTLIEEDGLYKKMWTSQQSNYKYQN